MNEIDLKLSLIPFLVEKVTKGVKKQIKGCVRNIQNQIESHAHSVKYEAKRLEGVINNANKIQDWSAVSVMIQEHAQNKKLMYEMNKIHEDIRNEFLDIKLLLNEVELKTKGIKQ